jgi:hypothetical protein
VYRKVNFHDSKFTCLHSSVGYFDEFLAIDIPKPERTIST